MKRILAIFLGSLGIAFSYLMIGCVMAFIGIYIRFILMGQV